MPRGLEAGVLSRIHPERFSFKPQISEDYTERIETLGISPFFSWYTSYTQMYNCYLYCKLAHRCARLAFSVFVVWCHLSLSFQLGVFVRPFSVLMLASSLSLQPSLTRPALCCPVHFNTTIICIFLTSHCRLMLTWYDTIQYNTTLLPRDKCTKNMSSCRAYSPTHSHQPLKNCYNIENI